MKVSQAKENILKKIRQALSESTPIPFPQSEGSSPLFFSPPAELDVLFAEQFSKLLGKFIFCLNTQELREQLGSLVSSREWLNVYCVETKLKSLLEQLQVPGISANDLAHCDASVTSCEFLVARTGSIVMSAGQESGRTVSVYAPVHICIAYTSQLVYDVKDGLQLLKDKYKDRLPSMITFATGPSRTADIEKTLVVGVHGPKEVYLFLVDDGNHAPR